VAFNFEDPDDSTASAVTFGAVDPSQVKGGSDGLFYYDNIG